MDKELQHAAGDDTVAQIGDDLRIALLSGHQQCGDKGDIEQPRGKCGGGKVVAVLQEGTQKGDREDQRQVEKVDGDIGRGQGDGLSVEADGDGNSGGLGKEVDRQGQQGDHQKKGAEDMDGEDRLVLRTGKCGDKGLGKGPFGKDAAKEVGKLEGDEKDIAVDVGPQDRSGQKVTEKCCKRWREIEKKVIL